MGDNLASMALDLRAASLHSSGFLAALLIGQSTPAILLGLTGGVLADRRLRWWTWPSALLLQAAVFVAMSRTRSAAWLVTGLTIVSVIAALTGSVATKLLAHHTDDATRSGGHVAVVMGLSQAIGVALGGLGFATVGASRLLLINAVTFALFAVIGLCTATGGAIELDASTGRGALLGFRRLTSPTAFGGIGLAVIVATVVGTSIEGVVGIFVLTGHARLGPATVGLAVAMWGVGVIGGGTLGRSVAAWGSRAMAWASVAMGTAFAAVALLQSPPALVIGWYALGGLANGVFNARLVAVIRQSVPGHEQGRTWAAFHWITAVCLLVGYLAGGALGATHAVPAMAASGAIAIVAGLGGLAGRRAHRHVAPVDG